MKKFKCLPKVKTFKLRVETFLIFLKKALSKLRKVLKLLIKKMFKKKINK